MCRLQSIGDTNVRSDGPSRHAGKVAFRGRTKPKTCAFHETFFLIIFFLPLPIQITKSIISLMRYYSWKKFSIITEEPWKPVADSLKLQAKKANMTINHFESIGDQYKCCELDRKCCNNGYWYTLIKGTMRYTRSTSISITFYNQYTRVHIIINIQLVKY